MNRKSIAHRPGGYNRFYKVNCSWYASSGNYQEHELERLNRGEALKILNRKLKDPNTIAVTIILDNKFVAKQQATFFGPSYEVFRSENV